jgi:hypothetical protein
MDYRLTFDEAGRVRTPYHFRSMIDLQEQNAHVEMQLPDGRLVIGWLSRAMVGYKRSFWTYGLSGAERIEPQMWRHPVTLDLIAVWQETALIQASARRASASDVLKGLDRPIGRPAQGSERQLPAEQDYGARRATHDSTVMEAALPRA